MILICFTVISCSKTEKATEKKMMVKYWQKLYSENEFSIITDTIMLNEVRDKASSNNVLKYVQTIDSIFELRDFESLKDMNVVDGYNLSGLIASKISNDTLDLKYFKASLTKGESGYNTVVIYTDKYGIVVVGVYDGSPYYLKQINYYTNDKLQKVENLQPLIEETIMMDSTLFSSYN